MALYIDFDDLTPEATKRLLKQAVCGEMVRQLPIGKRKEAMARMQEQADGYEEDEWEHEREELANLKAESVGPDRIPVTRSDFSLPAKKPSKKAVSKRK